MKIAMQLRKLILSYVCIHVPKVITVLCDVSGCGLVVALTQPSTALHWFGVTDSLALQVVVADESH